MTAATPTGSRRTMVRPAKLTASRISSVDISRARAA